MHGGATVTCCPVVQGDSIVGCLLKASFQGQGDLENSFVLFF